MIIYRNYLILLIMQLQCFYISSLKQYKTSGSLSIIFKYFKNFLFVLEATYE